MRALLLGILILAACPLSAEAAKRKPTNDLSRALSIAKHVWHPNCGDLQVAVETPDPAWPLGDAYGGWAFEGDCLIRLAPRIASGPWPVLCDTILHEAGHVAAYRDPTNTKDPHHSRNANSIMFPIALHAQMNGRWVDVDRRCRV